MTIVNVDLVQVERVLGRLNWQKVILGGVASGAWLGVFVGLVLGLFTGGFLAPLMLGVTMGIVFGVVSTALPYAAARGNATSPPPCNWSPADTTCCATPPPPSGAREKLSHLATV